jgi:hypothetical protein
MNRLQSSRLEDLTNTNSIIDAVHFGNTSMGIIFSESQERATQQLIESQEFMMNFMNQTNLAILENQNKINENQHYLVEKIGDHVVIPLYEQRVNDIGMHFLITIEQKVIPFINDVIIHFSKGEILIMSNIWTEDASITVQSNILLIENELLSQYLKTSPGAISKNDLSTIAQHGLKVLTTYIGYIKNVILSIEEAIKLIKTTENINKYIEKQVKMEPILADPYLLRDYLINLIDVKQREMMLFDTSATMAIQPLLRPEFEEYIKRHGPPGVDGFDLHLMEHVITDLKLQGVIKDVSLSNANIENPFGDILVPQYSDPTKTTYIKGHDFIDDRGRHTYHSDQTNVNVGLDKEVHKQQPRDSSHRDEYVKPTKNEFVHDTIGEYGGKKHNPASHTHDSKTGAVASTTKYKVVRDINGSFVYDKWGRPIIYDDAGIRWGQKYIYPEYDSLCKFCNTDHGNCKRCRTGHYVVQICKSDECESHCHGVCNNCGSYNYDTIKHEFHNNPTDSIPLKEEVILKQHFEAIEIVKKGYDLNNGGVTHSENDKHGHSLEDGSVIYDASFAQFVNDGTSYHPYQRYLTHEHHQIYDTVYKDLNAGREGTQSFWVHTKENIREVIFEAMRFNLFSITTEIDTQTILQDENDLTEYTVTNDLGITSEFKLPGIKVPHKAKNAFIKYPRDIHHEH